MDSQVIFIIIFMVVAYAGVFFFMQWKKKQQKNMFNDVNFNDELKNADSYKEYYLNENLSFLTKQMNGKPIDAFTFANSNYTTKDSIKDGLKDGLKGMATLGTVKFTTVQTPKYLVLSGADLHLFDTDVDSNISKHLIFDVFRLEKSSISELPLTNNIKAFVMQKGEKTKAYIINLSTGDKPVELILFSALIFSFATSASSFLSVNKEKVKQEIVIGYDFLKKLGDKYPNLKIELPNLN